MPEQKIEAASSKKRAREDDDRKQVQPSDKRLKVYGLTDCPNPNAELETQVDDARILQNKSTNKSIDKTGRRGPNKPKNQFQPERKGPTQIRV